MSNHFAPIDPDTEAKLYEAGAALLQVGKEVVAPHTTESNPLLNTSIATSGVQGMAGAALMGGMAFDEFARGCGAGLGYFLGQMDDATAEGIIQVVVKQMHDSIVVKRLARTATAPGKPN